jgi:hypothetical protein
MWGCKFCKGKILMSNSKPNNSEDLGKWLEEQAAKTNSIIKSEDLSKVDGSKYIIVKKDRLEALIESKVLEGKIEQVHKDLGGYSYTMPIKSVRTRNTAFKLYAVKFFNGVIAKRREKQLAELQSGRQDNSNG